MILGIESSCDETAAAVVSRDGHVRASVIASQVPIHARYGGVVPELASRSHLTAIRPTITAALDAAAVTLDDLTGIAVTTGPGLAGCLLIGLQVAKSIAWARGLPVIPIDHIQAHVHAPFLRDDEGAGPGDLVFPYVALAVSGGHTSLMLVTAPGEAEVLGQTLDDAAGEAFDKVAKMMGLPYPGGVYIDRIARAGRADAYELPRPMQHRGLDLSFSGLKTAARYLIEALGDALTDETVRADLAASVQEAIVDVLVTKALRACKIANVPRLVIAGGVACNGRLRERIAAACLERGIAAVITPARYCSDNAAMIAGLGAARFDSARLEGAARLSLDIYATRRPAR